jgi:two-component system, OmpR family, phosphate regulon sensor histidine kinase PhoR
MRVRTESTLAGATAAAAALVTAVLTAGLAERSGLGAFAATSAAVAAGLAAGAGVGSMVGRTASGRLAWLHETAEAYARGDLSRRLRSGPHDLGDILRPLDDAFQALSARLAVLTRDRARMEAILSGMVEGVLVVDEQGVVQLANEAARRALRVRDDPVGRRYVELVRHPDIEAQISRALRGESTDAQELTIAQEPAQTIMAQATRVSGEDSHGVVLVLHDITGLRRADRIRRDFVANVSHELRTPLTAIRGYVEALLDLVSADAEQRRFLEIIARHSARMEGLVKDLLRLTRLEAGQEPLDRVACAPAHLFDGVVHDLEPLLGRRHQHVTTSVAADAASLVGDPAKLHDVLRNLIENAANYAPERTTIALSARRDPDHVALVVEDEGPGIPEADLQRIFERFYRVDKARSRETGGTGLGLSIVKHLVGLHGGDVRAENRPTGGARFTVRIPA